MSEQQPLEASAPWVQLTVTDDDWDAAEPALLVTMFSQLALIRAFGRTCWSSPGPG
jgi:2-oxoisovalerate dehydrogenase E1 component